VLKPSKKKAGDKSKSTTTVKKSATKSPYVGNSNQTAMMLHRVCGLTDPFCDHAKGARYFDSNGTHSLAYPQKRMIPLATNANGELGLLLVPNYNNQWYLFGATAAGNTAYAGTMTAAPVLGNTLNYRVVSWGFTIKHVTTPLTASGLISIRGFGSQAGSSYANVDGQTLNADVISDIPLQDCKNVAVIGRKANNTSSFYVAPNTTVVTGGFVTDYVGCGWDVYQIYVTGAPVSTTIAYLELTINFEIILDDFTGMAQLMTPPPPSSLVMQTASAAVTSTAKSVFETGIAAASNYIKRSAATALASYFGGPSAGAATAMLLD